MDMNMIFNFILMMLKNIMFNMNLSKKIQKKKFQKYKQFF